MAQIREAAATPPPRTLLSPSSFPSDSDLLRTFLRATAATGSRSTSRSHSRQSNRSPDLSGGKQRTGGGGGGSGGGGSSGGGDRTASPRNKATNSNTSTAVLNIMLAETERQTQHLRTLLRMSEERILAEVRRADASEARALRSEDDAREARSRAIQAEHDKHSSLLETARLREEAARAQVRAVESEREVRRLSAELEREKRDKRELEEKAAEARDLARKWQGAVRDQRAWEEGREEGRVMMMYRRYDEGRNQGFEEGRDEGYEEGRLDGFKEGRRVGLEEGRGLGRREERVRASPAAATATVVDVYGDHQYHHAAESIISRSAPITVPINTRLPADVRRNIRCLVYHP
jgi:flagellar biosynthesis/type III secretory pathway protein FliH